ncbi:MAG: hypothetical protein HY726_11490, partial [Candidatus Rokubacteria bacterium]|nr:hypothetical protein [Candidatus Rokubacteria bacterium]
TNVYYHRTTRGIDLHLKEIFRDTMQIVFPWDLRKELHPYLHLTEWTLLEEVGRWHDSDDPERKAFGQEWRQILDRRLKWRMSHEVVLDIAELQRGLGFMKADEVEARVRKCLPARLRDLAFRVDMALQDPRPLNPLALGDRQIYVYDSGSKRVSKERLTELFKYLPGKVAQCRIFATTHEHDQLLAEALERALGEDAPSIVTNV